MSQNDSESARSKALTGELRAIFDARDITSLRNHLEQQKSLEDNELTWSCLPDDGLNASHLDLVRVLMQHQKARFDDQPFPVYAFLQDFPRQEYLDTAIEAGIHMSYDSYTYPQGFLKDLIREDVLPLLRYITKPEVYKKTDLYPNHQSAIDEASEFVAKKDRQ